MTTMLDFPTALIAAGVNVRVLDTWDLIDPAGYVWREDSGDPAGHMHHHTATASYVPNTLKANGYAGMSKHGGDRLYQEDYGDSVPVYTIANAYPAPVSSGYGDISVLQRVRQGIEVVGRQGPDNPPKWAGNTHYWNTEWILDGTGSPIEPAVWEMMLTVCRVQNDLMGWTPNMHIAHGHHTRRKVDLWGGQFSDTNRDGFTKTIEALRKDMEQETESNMPPLDIFLAYLRIVDIEKMGADHIITAGEVTYFTTEPMWTAGQPTGNTDVNESDWENLYNAYRTRAPIWAV